MLRIIDIYAAWRSRLIEALRGFKSRRGRYNRRAATLNPSPAPAGEGLGEGWPRKTVGEAADATCSRLGSLGPKFLAMPCGVALGGDPEQLDFGLVILLPVTLCARYVGAEHARRGASKGNGRCFADGFLSSRR